jgi:hypothetical protein
VKLTAQLEGAPQVARSRKPKSPEASGPGEEATDARTPGEDTAPPRTEGGAAETAAPGENLEDVERQKEPALIEETVETATIVDAEVVDDRPGSDEAPPSLAETAEARADDDLPEPEVRPEAESHIEPAPETVPEPAAARPAPPPPQMVRSGPGFLPLFLGGVAAAGLGFVLARYAVPEGWPNPPVAPAEDVSAAVESQASRLAGLEQQLTDLAAKVDAAAAQPAPTVDVEALRDQVIAALPASTDAGAMDALQSRIDDLVQQVQAVAAQPAEPPAPTEDQMAAFQAQLDGAVAEARSQIEAAQAEAARIEAEAAEAAEKAAATAALEQVAAALDTGAEYAEPLAVVVDAGVTVPEALTAGADGSIPTLPTLQAEFPDAARAALDASIRAGEADTTMERAIAFLRTQTGARSLTPREGDDPDAVLSRAEAALRDGNLSAALTELGALPETGLAAMADWKAAAESRQAAVSALDELRTGLETN